MTNDPTQTDALKAAREALRATFLLLPMRDGSVVHRSLAKNLDESDMAAVCKLIVSQRRAAVEAARQEIERLQHIVDLLTDEFVRYNLPQTNSVEDAIKALVAEIGRKTFIQGIQRAVELISTHEFEGEYSAITRVLEAELARLEKEKEKDARTN